MTDIQRIALLQRIVNSIKEEIAINPTKAIGKLEILEGELGVLRQVAEEKIDKKRAKKAKKQKEEENTANINKDIIDVEEPQDVDIIDSIEESEINQVD